MFCAKDNKPIKKNFISCSRCQRYWHPSCTGLKGSRGGRSSWPEGLCPECTFAPLDQAAHHGGQQQQGHQVVAQCPKCPEPMPQSEQQELYHHSLRQNQQAGLASQHFGQFQPLLQFDEQQNLYGDVDEDQWYQYSRVELDLMEKCRKLDSENRKLKDVQDRLAKDMHRIKDTTRNNILAVRRMRIRQEVQSQEALCKVVEIQNLFQRPGEDVKVVLLALLALVQRRNSRGPSNAAVSCPLVADDVDDVFRLPFGPPGPNKSVVVTFREKAKCDMVMRLRWPVVIWQELASELGAPLAEREDPNEIYINHYLTPHFRRLLGVCRRVCKRVGIQTCYYRNCKVMIRHPAGAPKPLSIEAADDMLLLLPSSMRKVVEDEIASDKAFSEKIANDKKTLFLDLEERRFVRGQQQRSERRVGFEKEQGRN